MATKPVAPPEPGRRKTKRTQQEDDTLATLDRRRRPIGDERRNLSYSFEYYSPIKCGQHPTTLHSRRKKESTRKAQQQDDTLQRSIDVGDRSKTNPGNLSYKIRIPNSERHFPFKCDQSPPPTLHSHRTKANPTKPNSTTTPWGARSAPNNDWRRTQEILQLGPLSQPNAVSLRGI